MTNFVVTKEYKRFVEFCNLHIPTQIAQRFRSKPNSNSDLIRTTIPIQFEQ